jgi:hypothetical protein
MHDGGPKHMAREVKLHIRLHVLIVVSRKILEIA